MPKPINLIVACSENRVIGRNRQLPFAIPEDKAWFHEQTANKIVILGQICFEMWPGARTGGRTPIVVSRDQSLASEHVRVAANMTEALALAQTLPGEIMITGGQRIYEESLPVADRLLLTLVHAEIQGDTWFPEWRHLPWREIWKREGRDANYHYTFSNLERQW